MAERMLSPSAALRGAPWGLASATLASAALVMLLALWHPALALLPVAMLAAVPVVVWLFRRPLLNLCVVLAGFILIADYTEGLGIQEVLYGLYFILFIGHWFITRVALYRASVFSQTASKATLLFILTATFTVGLSIAFYHSPTLDAIREWRMLLMISLFFPVREAVEQHRWAIWHIGFTMIIVWSFIALRNVLDYRSIIINAVYQYQLGRGRVIINDNVMMISSVCLATFALFTNRLSLRLILGVLWGLCFVSLILTQSRSYWVAFAFALGLLVLASPWNVRKRIGVIAACGLALLVLLGGALFADEARTIMAGLVNRMASISSAVTVDISFISRLYEARGALARVPESILLGHGPGATYTFTDIIYRHTGHWSFIHNGYVSLLFKYGLWGAGLAITLWVSSIANGYAAYRSRTLDPFVRIAGLASALCLCGYLLSALAAPPFTMDDNTFNMGLLTGVATGARARAMREAEGQA